MGDMKQGALVLVASVVLTFGNGFDNCTNAQTTEFSTQDLFAPPEDVANATIEGPESTLSMVDELPSSTIEVFEDILKTTEGSQDYVEMNINSTEVSSYEASFVETVSKEIHWKWLAIQWSWLQCMQMISSVIGIIGQILVMTVIWQRRAMNRSTDTLIGALAVADFTTSVFIIPLPVATSVPSSILGEVYCRLIYTGFFMWVAVGASNYTLALISIERLVAVMYPIYFNRISSRRHAYMAIIALWLSMLVFVSNLIITYFVDVGSHTCDYSFAQSVGVFIAFKTFVGYFLIPGAIMLIAQAVTAVTLHRKSKVFKEGNVEKNRSNPSYNLLVAKNRVIKMLFIVVMIFIICWGPNNVAYFLLNFGYIPRAFAFSSTRRILTMLAFYNSCLNPIVYTVRHPEFRSAIRGLFTGSKTTKKALFEYKHEDVTKSRPSASPDNKV